MTTFADVNLQLTLGGQILQNNVTSCKPTGRSFHRSGDQMYLEMIDTNADQHEARVILAPRIFWHLSSTPTSLPRMSRHADLDGKAFSYRLEAIADVCSHPSSFRSFTAPMHDEI
jgi:hypothetical protein